jgi:hypothetical protein
MTLNSRRRLAGEVFVSQSFLYVSISIILTMFLVITVGCGKKKEEKQYEKVGWLEDGPRCVIRDRLRGSGTVGNAVKQFAKSNGFRECEVPHYSIYSGPGYVNSLYKNEQFVIWSHSINSSVYFVAAYNTNYSLADFERLTNALITTLEKNLPGRIEVNSRPPEAQSGLSGGGETNFKRTWADGYPLVQSTRALE